MINKKGVHTTQKNAEELSPIHVRVKILQVQVQKP